MAITVTNIISRRLAETAATIQYNANGVTTIIDKFTVTNVGASNTFITVYLPNPNSAGNPLASNTVINANNCASGDLFLPRVDWSGDTRWRSDCDAGWNR